MTRAGRPLMVTVTSSLAVVSASRRSAHSFYRALGHHQLQLSKQRMKVRGLDMAIVISVVLREQGLAGPIQDWGYRLDTKYISYTFGKTTSAMKAL